MKLIGYNMKLKKSEEINRPSLVVFKGQGNRKDRYAATGKGSDGTTMFKILGKPDFDSLKASGLSVEMRTAGAKSKSKSKSKSKGKSGGAPSCGATGGKRRKSKSKSKSKK